ncbi:MAG: DUF507 family protein [Thermodesulfovibrionales bacterium]|nr:DUF507 family protein [Thermodesulfovibrionales bacterium]
MLSSDKVTCLTHIVLKGLLDKNLITLKDDAAAVRRGIKQAITAELKVGEDMDKAARQKLQSFSKKLIEGSPEWEILYKKFMKEEEVKKGRG